MDMGRRWPPQAHIRQHKTGQQPMLPHRPGVVQPKATAPQMKPRPSTPPVHRPQPSPAILQPKASASAQPLVPAARSVPTAPPAYRPQPAPRVLQPKKASVPSPAAGTSRPPVALPVYRPEPKKVVQPMVTAQSHRQLMPGRKPPQSPTSYRPGPQSVMRPAAVGSVVGGRGAARPTVIQRAITIGQQPLPRTSSMTTEVKTYLMKEGVYKEFSELNDDRKFIYIFSSNNHLITYLKETVGLLKPGTTSKPITHKISQTQLDKSHKLVQDVRFTNIYEPSPNQFPDKVKGVHNIPEEMLPPPGTHHHYMKSSNTFSKSKEEYSLFLNKFTNPTPTLPLTYGNPNKKPSLVMNQGGLNLGMYISPTDDDDYYEAIKRSKTTYGGLKSVSDRVRGHPLALAQNQYSTDGKTDFDKDRRTYTDESDSTKKTGGVSTWRYNQIERVALKNKEPFLQVNMNPKKGSMGIVKPDEIFFRRRDSKSKSGYDDILIDNTGKTDYRNPTDLPKKKRKQEHQSDMGRKRARKNSYKPPTVHKPGQDFDDPNKSSYPGYVSPPPTPFFSEDFGEPFRITLKGRKRHKDRVLLKTDGRKCIVEDVIKYDSKSNSTTCMLVEVPKTEWPSSFK